jgi:hypothetical protein
MGDSSNILCPRLFTSEEEAQALYNDRWLGITYPSLEELDEAKLTAEKVVIETQYGSRDKSFREMITPYCMASKEKRLITDGPDYADAQTLADMMGYGDYV